MTSETTQEYSKADYEYVTDLLNGLDIPSNKILFPHVRLKGLRQKDDILNLEYETLTKLLLDSFTDVFHPKTILVPTFTYSFTDSGVYHRKFSKSEVGRFSEEVRKKFSEFRTPDPIFSVADMMGYLQNKQIDYTTAFGEGGLFEFLHEENCAIINIDLSEILMTQVHYIEKKCGVSYRYDKEFEGIVYKDEQSWQDVKYEYFVRDLDDDPQMDHEKREQFLRDQGGLQSVKKDGITGSWISAQQKHILLSEKMDSNERYLLEN